jgi:hypothetical protein
MFRMTRLWNWFTPAGRSIRSAADVLFSSRGWVSRRGTLLLSIACVIVCLAANGLSHGAGRQTETAKEHSPSIGVPRFELPQSGLEWRSVAQPQKYFDATGHRAAILGKQDGRFEAWIYPLKLFHAFHPDFRQDGMIEPARGEDYLREIITRPESTTLVYVHPLFTIREIVWVPHDEPAAMMFFDVDSNKPITITARFTPDFKPMWPASLGGQYSFWIPEDRAFGLTDGTSLPTAIIGSPAVSEYTDFVDNGLINGELELKLRVTVEQARAALIPLVMALSMDSPEKAREIYRGAASHARELYNELVSYPRDFLGRTMQIETPDAELNRAFTWSKAAIEAGWACNNTYGCGLVAGYGPSGSSERPGFDWWFGGDALMSSWAMEDYGDFAGALQVFRFLKTRQRNDGKMMTNDAKRRNR